MSPAGAHRCRSGADVTMSNAPEQPGPRRSTLGHEPPPGGRRPGRRRASSWPSCPSGGASGGSPGGGRRAAEAKADGQDRCPTKPAEKEGRGRRKPQEEPGLSARGRLGRRARSPACVSAGVALHPAGRPATAADGRRPRGGPDLRRPRRPDDALLRAVPRATAGRTSLVQVGRRAATRRRPSGSCTRPASSLAGLLIMFASLQLARTEQRANAVLRRMLYGFNSVFVGLLLLLRPDRGQRGLVHLKVPNTLVTNDTAFTELSERVEASSSTRSTSRSTSTW